jgi:hypothetical protein
MMNIATALADVLAADRTLCECEINLKYVNANPTHGYVKINAEYDRQTAAATLDAMSEELIAAMDEWLSTSIRRAVASMPGQPTGPTQDYET